MRILVLGMFAVAEGELTYEARMIHHLAALGNDVDYWTDSPISYAMEPVLKQPKTLRSFVFHEGKNALAKTPRSLHPLDLRKIISEHGPHTDLNKTHVVGWRPYDVIFTTAQTGIDMGVPLKQILGIPLVVQILDVPWWRLDDAGPYEIYKQSVVTLPLFPHEWFDQYRSEWTFWFNQLDQCDAVTTILEESAKQVVLYTKFLTGKDIPMPYVSWHGSIDQDTFDYYISKEKIEKKNQVICLNRIDFHKGVDQTVLICKMIQDAMGDESPEFVFVSRGNQPWYEQEIKDFATRQLRKVRFTGWIDNPTKIRLIRESKLLIDNEWPNGFGGCCLAEALYCDTHAMAWNTPSKREVHPDGVNLIEPGNFNLMAKVAVGILNGEATNSTLNMPMGSYNDHVKAFIREKRSNLAHAQSIERLLKEVAKK